MMIKTRMSSPTEKIYFNFSIEVWTADEEQIVEVLARCDNTDIAQAAFKAACEIRPRDCVLLRNGIRVVDRRPAP